MLVLSRKAGESLRIGDDVSVTVIQTKGDTVSLGINAPKGIPILREELYQAIVQANISATNTQVDALLKILSETQNSTGKTGC